MTPLTKYFCIKTYRTTAGTVATTMQQYLATSAFRSAACRPPRLSAYAAKKVSEEPVEVREARISRSTSCSG